MVQYFKEQNNDLSLSVIILACTDTKNELK